MGFLLPWMAADIGKWEKRAVAPGVHAPPKNIFHDSYERILAVEPIGAPQAQGAYERVGRAIMAFDIFPDRLGSAIVSHNPLRPGDCAGLRYHLLPGLDIFFASRVLAVWDHRIATGWECGFHYQTLTGHPELGEETFFVRKIEATGEIRAGLTSWSRPAWAILQPIVPLARHLQTAAGPAALDHLERIAQRSIL